ncbi:MAG: nucleoside hydrolase, partial [Bacilli bacterium]|nr:nucleoside hydrolase [Bacilli bacterium]
TNYNFPFDSRRDITKPFLNQEKGKWLILDTDMNTDVDDVCALRMATTLDDLGVIDLKAVCYCENYSDLEAVRGLLHYDNKDDVIIGQGTEDNVSVSPYWNVLRQYSDNGGERDNAVRQYRKILESATTPVDIVTIGYLTNLEELLKSEPDDISDKTGKQLVLEKVGQLYIAGGEYPTGWSNNLAYSKDAREATKYVIENWGLPIILSPGNHSGKLVCGKYLQELDINRLDPVSKSLSAFGTEIGRTAWDPFLVWVAGYGCRELNQVRLEQCSFDINIESGTNTFVPDSNGKVYAIHLINTDLNYYNQVMDNHLIYGLTKKYGIENPNKHPIGLE